MVSTSGGSLGVLSDELVIQILHYGGCQDIRRIATTCKHYHDIVAQSTSLQLHLELEANGLEIIPGSRIASVDYSIILKELRCYRDAWLDLNLDEPIEKAGNAKIMTWELNKGCFAAATGTGGPLSLQLIPLGNSTHPDLSNLQRQFQSFSVDPEQDLVVLAEPRSIIGQSKRATIQLLSALDGMPHPLAYHPTLNILVDFEIPGGDIAVEFQIMDNILAVKITDFAGTKYELAILDWKSGMFLQRIASGSSPVVSSFVYLDKERIVMASGTGFGRTTSSSAQLLVYNIYSKPPSSDREAMAGPNYRLRKIVHSEPSLVFQLPEIDSRFRLSTLLFIRAGPSTSHAVHTQSVAFSYPRVPTLTLSLGLNGQAYFTASLDFRIFVDVSQLFKYILNAKENSRTVIPWAEWGPQATRWFSDHGGEALQWDHMIFGSRWLRITDKSEHKPPYELSVFEFNSRTIMRHAKRNTENYVLGSECEDYRQSIGDIVLQGSRLKEHLKVRCIIRDWRIKDSNDRRASIEIIGSDMPTVLTKGFKVPVESRLPYRIVSKFQEMCCREWTMDGEHIVGINPCDVNPMMFEAEYFGGPGDEPPKIAVFKIKT